MTILSIMILVFPVLLLLNLFRMNRFDITSFKQENDLLIIEVSHRPYFWSFREVKSKYAAKKLPMVWYCVAGPPIKQIEVILWSILESAWKHNQIQEQFKSE